MSLPVRSTTQSAFKRAFALRVAAQRTLVAAVLVIGAGGCTTTVSNHGPDVSSIQRTSTPGTLSEVRIAQTALESGNIEMARTLFARVVEREPNSVAALTGLGDTLYAVGDNTRAGVYYARARQADAAAVAPLIGLGRVAIRERRLDDAIAAYREARTRAPGDVLSAAGLGVALDLKHEHAEAQHVLREALRAHPGDPMLSVDLGLSLVLGGNPREGANLLLDVTRYPEAPREAREDLALAYGLLGNDDAARAILAADLPKASIEDNLRFYKALRAAARNDDARARPPGRLAAGPTPADSSAAARSVGLP
jgi:Flp pilus assembly protein TadD